MFCTKNQETETGKDENPQNLNTTQQVSVAAKTSRPQGSGHVYCVSLVRNRKLALYVCLLHLPESCFIQSPER